MELLTQQRIDYILKHEPLTRVIEIHAFLDDVGSEKPLLGFNANCSHWRHGSTVELTIHYKGETRIRQFDLLSENFDTEFANFRLEILELIND